MKLKSFNYFFGFLIIFTFTQLKGEQKIDIWNNKNIQKEVNEKKDIKKEEKIQNKIIIQSNETNNQKIKIEKNLINSNEEDKIFGLYDPETNDLDLNMWSSTPAEDVRASLKRLKLSLLN